VTAAVLGIVIAAMLWWMYFDIVALVSERRLVEAPEGLERNRMARDSFSYLHFPMIAGIILVALGLKKTLEHVDEPLKLVPAFALLGGAARACATRWRRTEKGKTRCEPGGAAQSEETVLRDHSGRTADLCQQPLRRAGDSTQSRGNGGCENRLT
jgi:hypothetical protein